MRRTLRQSMRRTPPNAKAPSLSDLKGYAMDALRLVNGLPDAIPRTLPLFSLNNRSEWKYEVITDKSVGGRSTASFHVAKLPGGGVR
mmetsp:Transcript_24972/g.85588  ORF Transcript_24972/g.85588 Transcript_24972/m.85588 type:complete len:87 (+) Transcript_24972:303-563(+)